MYGCHVSSDTLPNISVVFSLPTYALKRLSVFTKSVCFLSQGEEKAVSFPTEKERMSGHFAAAAPM